jgi:tetratricopeptide (TPR) repeat protein
LSVLAATRTRDQAAFEQTLAALPADDLGKPEIQLALGERAMQAGDRESAARHFEACLAADSHTPVDDYLILEIGIAHLAADSIEAATTVLRRLERNPPLAAKAQVNIGVAEARRGNLPNALTRFERAVAIDPRSVSAHGNLGKALLAAGEPTRALRHLEEARRLAGPSFAFRAEYDAARHSSGRPRTPNVSPAP